MRVPFVPAAFEIPHNVSVGNYVLSPITTKDNDEDYKAVLHNAETITNIRGGSGDKNSWPYAFSSEENYKDLAWLETCFSWRQLFSYIIRSSADNTYVGCLYIYPIELSFPEKADRFEVDFSFWLTKSEFEKGVYDEVAHSLLKWLSRDWPFKPEKIYFRNRLVPKKN